MISSTAGHTAGPWTPNFHHTMEYAGRTYAFIFAPGNPVPVATVLLGVEGNGQDEGRANARLIAAAPTLLIALEKIVNLAKPGQSVNVSQATDIICDIWNEAVIAAAKGGA